jgi:ketosteroid isomerase-like protein
MLEHPNIELARRSWLAVSEGDAAALRTLWSEKILWHAAARAPWTGDHEGLSAILDHLASVGELCDHFRAQLIDLLASDERVLVLFHVSLSRGERVLELDYQLLARIENGLAVEIWTMPLEPEAMEHFWAN